MISEKSLWYFLSNISGKIIINWTSTPSKFITYTDKNIPYKVKTQWTVSTLITTYLHWITSVLLLMAATNRTPCTVRQKKSTKTIIHLLWKKIFLEFLPIVQWWEHFAGNECLPDFKGTRNTNKIGYVGSKGTHIRLLFLKLRDLKFLWCSLCQSPFLWMLEV